MKEIAIIGSYANSEEKIKLLERCIRDCKGNGLDVLLYAKFPISDKIHNLCDYYIFEKSNPLIKNRKYVVWRLWANMRITFSKEEYGFSALGQIINGLGFSYLSNYDIAHYINYDVNLENYKLYREKINELIKINDIVLYKFGKYGDNIGVDLTHFSVNIKKTYPNLKSLINVKHYEKVVNQTGKLAEAFFYDCLNITNLKYHLIDEPLLLVEEYSEQIDRLYGKISENYNNLLKYFEFFYIGTFKGETTSKKIMIYNIKKIINYIKIDIGTEILEYENMELTNWNNYIYYEIDLFDKIPNKLIILKINDEEINQILENELNDNYWKNNLLEKIK